MVPEKRGYLIVLVALLIFFISLSVPVFSAGEVCYTFIDSADYCMEISSAQANANCLADQCVRTDHIKSGSCASVAECELVQCNVDGNTMTLGECRQLGLDKSDDILPGAKVINSQELQAGCCKVGNSCSPSLNEWQCKLEAARAGITYRNDFRNLIYDQQLCLSWCGEGVVSGSVSGRISDQNNNPLSEVKVSINSSLQDITAADGKYLIENIPPGTYVLNVVLNPTLNDQRQVQILSNRQTEENFVLAAKAKFTVSGKVTASSGAAIANAVINWESPLGFSGTTRTDDEGKYSLSLSQGSYILTANRNQFVSSSKDLVVDQDMQNVDFVLPRSVQQGISGKVYLDGEAVSGARIYLNGAGKGFSLLDGSYFISAEAGTYQISAKLSSYQSLPVDVQVKAGETKNLDLTLYQTVDECPAGEKPSPTGFNAYAIPGEKAVKLVFSPPCREIFGYTLTKIKGNERETKDLSGRESFFIDNKVEWGQDYSYELAAEYAAGKSEAVKAGPLNVGNQLCEDKYDAQSKLWDSFCLNSGQQGSSRQKVYTCSDNQIIEAATCGGNSYCFQFENAAFCKDASYCSAEQQQALPFGLYYDKLSCVDENNFCYYDHSSSITEKCESCVEINSCFGYQSQDACERNSCGFSECEWIDGASGLSEIKNAGNYVDLIDYGFLVQDAVREELSAGYCAEKEYKKADQCSSCGPEVSRQEGIASSIFENYYCTPQICAGLGACFSEQDLSICNSCPEEPSNVANCYEYQSELECVGGTGPKGQPFAVAGNSLLYSKDQCSWGRCSWDNQAKECYKDGDARNGDDCVNLPSSEQFRCRKDIMAPATAISGKKVLSLSDPKLTFSIGGSSEGSNEESSGTLHFCLLDASFNSVGSCNENILERNKLRYPLTTNPKIEVNIIKAIDEKVNNRNYLLKYFSKDRYSNREEMKETFLIVDNVAPEFRINAEHTTEGGETDLNVYLEGENELMSCDFILEQIFPLGPSTKQTVGKEVIGKKAVFSGLRGINYELTVVCTDMAGNKNEPKKEQFTFDLESNVDLIYPEVDSAIATTKVAFQVRTGIDAICELRSARTDQTITTFDTKDFQNHITPELTLEEGKYFNVYKAVCRQSITNQEYEDYFSFDIDFHGPETQIVLKEDSREIKPNHDGSLEGWEKFFVAKAEVDFECSAEGFECNSTYYCLGEDCRLNRGASSDLEDSRYLEYNGTILVEESTSICYYSVDIGRNKEGLKCGNIVIEGHKIILQNPKHHLYQNEIWGVSNRPEFDVIFTTKIETSQCRYDFISGFPYETTPLFKILDHQADGTYQIKNFPTDKGTSSYSSSGSVKKIYVRCADALGTISPEIPINLEYDPSAPLIKSALADPDPVIEGITTEIIVQTDDKTVCKYDESGKTEYEALGHFFPGSDKNILKTEHRSQFNIVFLGLKKDYSLNVLCKNAAGDVSKLETLKFSVDYTQLGNIVSVWPQGESLQNKEITAKVETSKNAQCSYFNSSARISLVGGGSTFHTLSLINLTEKNYQIPFQCLMGEHKVENKFSFTIDRTAPIITSINDGNYSCGLDVLSVYVYSSEGNISGYAYEVYDLGVQPRSFTNTSTRQNNSMGSSSSRYSYTSYRYNSTSVASAGTTSAASVGAASTSTRATLVSSGTAGKDMPINVSLQNVTEGTKYYLKIKAGDAAGNWGEFKESDGFIVVPSNYSACMEEKGGPKIILEINDTECGQSMVEMHCQSSLGCKDFKYALSESLLDCKPNQNYNGQKLTFSSAKWLCYSVADTAGNNNSGQKMISFEDEDGDKIRDSCDQCFSTSAGNYVDELGCAMGEVPNSERGKDTDGDSLPDLWEKKYETDICLLSFVNVDSDDDGIKDDDEDYDSDGVDNYREYLGQKDPCLADAAKPGEKEEKKELELPPLPGEQEKDNTVAWVLLIIGILMVISGTAYLIYYYNYSPAGSKEIKAGAAPVSGRAISRPSREPVTEAFKSKLLRSRMEREERRKAKARSSLFGEFSAESEKIPHMQEFLTKKSIKAADVHDLAKKYAEHKEEINPGLKSSEKGIFAELEKIASQKKENINQGDAEDIFAKLKQIAEKRKKK